MPPTYEEFTPGYVTSFHDPCMLKDITWLVSGALLRKGNSNGADHLSKDIPTWAAYHSLTGSEKPLTVIGTPPLLSEPPHDWQTLITVIKQAQI